MKDLLHGSRFGASRRAVSGFCLARALGVRGWEALDPILLAAWTSEKPLVLVGAAGSARRAVLQRLASSAGLTFRRYNMARVRAEDLFGFAFPDLKAHRVRYLEGPTDLWDAEVLLFEDLQGLPPHLEDPLCSILAERAVWGRRLLKLRYCWGTLNVDPQSGSPAPEWTRQPSPALDEGLLGCFNFFVRVPRWRDLSRHDQVALLRPRPPGTVPGAELRPLLETARSWYEEFLSRPPDRLARYLPQLTRVLQGWGLEMSTDRVQRLFDNVLAVHAARLALHGAEPETGRAERIRWNESALCALQHSLPCQVWAGSPDPAFLAAAHAHAWTVSGPRKQNSRQGLRVVEDPVHRLATSLRLVHELPGTELGACVLETLSEIRVHELRIAAALVAFLILRHRSGIPARVVETLAYYVQAVLAVPRTKQALLRADKADLEVVASLCASLTDIPIHRVLRNLLVTLSRLGFSGASPIEVARFFRGLWNAASNGAVPGFEDPFDCGFEHGPSIGDSTVPTMAAGPHQPAVLPEPPGKLAVHCIVAFSLGRWLQYHGFLESVCEAPYEGPRRCFAGEDIRPELERFGCSVQQVERAAAALAGSMIGSCLHLRIPPLPPGASIAKGMLLASMSQALKEEYSPDRIGELPPICTDLALTLAVLTRRVKDLYLSERPPNWDLSHLLEVEFYVDDPRLTRFMSASCWATQLASRGCQPAPVPEPRA